MKQLPILLTILMAIGCTMPRLHAQINLSSNQFSYATPKQYEIGGIEVQPVCVTHVIPAKKHIGIHVTIVPRNSSACADLPIALTRFLSKGAHTSAYQYGE